MSRPRIFVSYSHRDREYLGDDSLIGFLRGLEQEEDVQFWIDDQLETGMSWDEEIRSRLLTTDIALILISQAFLDSSYCRNVEMSTFLDRCRQDGMALFPIVLSACEWERHDWLAGGSPIPGAGETIEEHYREPGKRKRLFVRIRQELRAAIAAARTRKSSGAPAAAAPMLIHAAAERRQLTAVRCDLVPMELDGRPIDEDDLPEILHELMPEFLGVCRQTFGNLEGEVVQSIGSGVLGIFGYPVSHEDDSRCAVRAGMALIETVQKLGTRIESELGVRLAVRIGVHTGFVIADVASATIESLADNETTSIASALQEAGGINEVVVSDATYVLINRFFETAAPETLKLRGGRGEMQMYRVLRDTGYENQMQATMAAHTPLVAREQEMNLLIDRWTRARRGNGQVILLRADSGIGKSRLLAEMKGAASTGGAQWIEWHGAPRQQDTPFHAVLGWLESWTGLESGTSTAEKLARIELQVATLGGAPGDAAETIAGLLSIPLPKNAATRNAREQKDHILATLVQLLLDASLQKPLIFAVEDLQWIDASTMELLDLLIEQVPAAPILALVTSRLEPAVPAWATREYVSRLNLDRLDRTAASQMVLAITGGKQLPPEVFDQIFARTEGVPLFIEDLTRTAIESDLLVAGDDRYELVGPFRSLSIPATLQESLLARLAKLATAKPVAQIGATIGREFVFDVLRAVSGFDDAVLIGELNRLIAAGVLYKRGLLSKAKYVFKHALVQEALEQSLLRKQRRQYHKVIAEVLESKFRDVAGTQPELVAHHHSEAGDPGRAAIWWERAAQRALQAYANREALAQARRAIEALQSLPESAARIASELAVRMIEGAALIAIKGYAAPETRAAYEHARDLSIRSGAPAPFSVLHGLWKTQAMAARLHEAQATSAEMNAVAERANDKDLLLESHRARAMTRFWQGRADEAGAACDRALEIYEPDLHHLTHALTYGDDPGAACLTYAALSAEMAGQRGRSLECSRRAAELLDCSSHPYSRGFLIMGLAWAAIERRDVAAALTNTAALAELAEAHHFVAWVALAKLYRGWTMGMAGDASGGEELMAEGRREWHATGSRVAACWMPAKIADICASAGLTDDALQWVSVGLAGAEACEDRYYLPELHRLRAGLLLASGEQADAIAAYGEALRFASEQNATVLRVRAGTDLARFYIRDGKVAEAAALLEDVCAACPIDDGVPEVDDARALLSATAGEIA
ncbi:MAG TPA: AAA family ATPase [Thermoanaerobaculia bacterium]|jgi:class 3 adenylate cyclase/tetratricopeptide (TPR) repeat protein|nr:AAA family ATPase [Thermoanaerobaculia bacterium]